MLEFRERRAIGWLGRWIHSVRALRAPAEVVLHAPLMRTLPDGCTDVVVSFGDGIEDYPRAGAPAIKPAAFVFGPVTSARLARALGAVDAVSVLFRPGRLASLLAVPMSELTDAVVDATCFPVLELESLRAMLADQPDLDRRLSIVEEWLARVLLRAEPAPDRLVHEALARIRARRGVLRIGELARELQVSERTLERRFSRAVGLGPKAYARGLRFENALVALWRASDPSRGRPTFLDGFADQAHLTREFRSMSGLTPRTIVESIEREVVVRGLRESLDTIPGATSVPPRPRATG